MAHRERRKRNFIIQRGFFRSRRVIRAEMSDQLKPVARDEPTKESDRESRQPVSGEVRLWSKESLGSSDAQAAARVSRLAIDRSINVAPGPRGSRCGSNCV